MSAAIDVNILLFASDSRSALHARSSEFMRDLLPGSESICFGWPTLMGYLRIATHPAIFEHPLTANEAMSNVDFLVRAPNVDVLSEIEGFWDIYRNLTKTQSTIGNLVPDAHLAAILKQHNVTQIYTHDRRFRDFGFLTVIDPLT